MAALESGLLKVQQEPSDALQIAVEKIGAENVPKDELSLSSPESVVSIKEKLVQPCQDDVEHLWDKLSIYRMPHYLKDGEDKAHVPQVVSLGPYHHGKEHLRHMDQHKWRCFCRVLERSHHKRGLYLHSVKELEQRARACYEGIISMSSDDFVQMMVLDGCFVIELFRATVDFGELGYHHNDPIFSTRASILKTQIQRDMIMLENQIPLFILNRLLSLQLGKPDQENYVVKLAHQFLFPCTPFRGIMMEIDFSLKPCWLHCLGVYRSKILPSERAMEEVGIMTRSQRRKQPKLCVTELREAGIVFQNNPRASLGDIKFSDGILCIPKLMIHEGTMSLFLNLIAFEQCHFNCSNHITSYVNFMHNLIHSPEDVGHLCDHMILEHCLGSDAEVVDLFNRLNRTLAVNITDDYLDDLFIEMPLYCVLRRLPFKMSLAHKWNFWGADLRKNYFYSPWSTISVIAASILLVLTFTQTVYGVLSYHRQPRS